MGVDAAEFVDSVLLPLAVGGTLTVHAPLDADDVETLEAERSSMAGLAELAEVRRRTLTHVLGDAEPPPLDQDSIRLGAAIHNLCWLLAQPSQEQRGAVARVVAYTCKLCKLPPPSDDASLVARHSLVGRVRGLQRRDVRVRFWAGHREFRGEAPPKRLLRWGGVRRVRQEQTTAELFQDGLANAATRPVIVGLLRASPLTDLLTLQRTDPPVDLRNAARWLRSPRIARALADEYLSRGLPSLEPALSAALMALYDQTGSTAESATATAFHSHLHLLELISRPPRDREGHLQLIRGYTHGRERSVADGFGLFAAADRLGLGRPGDLARDPVLEKNVDSYAEACAELVGTRRLQELIGLLGEGCGQPRERVMMTAHVPARSSF